MVAASGEREIVHVETVAKDAQPRGAMVDHLCLASPGAGAGSSQTLGWLSNRCSLCLITRLPR